MSSEKILQRIAAGLAIGIVVLATACDVSSIFGSDCADVGYAAVTVTVRDQLGHGQALGATVTLQDGSYTETHSDQDTLLVYGAMERGGRTYDIHVTKPFYNEVWVRGVRAPRGGCGQPISARTIAVPVVLSLAPNVPPLRSIFLMPNYSPILDRGPSSTFTFATIIDASPGASRAVLWSVTGDTASASFDPATGTLTYRCRPSSGSLDVTATLAALPSLTATQTVRVQGHPVGTGDPPCS